MPIGMIMLLVIGVLVYFGVVHRILDRMRLTDKQALLLIGAIIIGSFIDIPIMRSPLQVSINLGGAILPAFLSIWLIIKADETAERVRADGGTAEPVHRPAVRAKAPCRSRRPCSAGGGNRSGCHR